MRAADEQERGAATMAAPGWGLDDDLDDYDDHSDLPPGFRFDPTDQELLGFYLPRKAAGKMIPAAIDPVIPTLDLFAPAAAPPWLLHPAAAASSSACYDDDDGIARCVAPRDSTEWFYCFARTTPRGAGSCRTTGSGTWLSSGRPKGVVSRGEALGQRSGLSFRVPAPGGVGAKGAGTSWVMHEFKKAAPAEKEEGKKELVLCRIRCTKRMGRREEEGNTTTPTTTHKRRRTSGGANELILGANPSKPSSSSVALISHDHSDGAPLESADSCSSQGVGTLSQSQGTPGQLAAMLQEEEDFWKDIDVDIDIDLGVWEDIDMGFVPVEQEQDQQLVTPEGDEYQSFSGGTREPGLLVDLFQEGLQDNIGWSASFAEQGRPPSLSAVAAASTTTAPGAGLPTLWSPQELQYLGY